MQVSPAAVLVRRGIRFQRMERGTRGAAVQDRRGRLTAVGVALWGVAAVTAVMEEGTHQSRQAPLQGSEATRRGRVSSTRRERRPPQEKGHRDDAGNVSGEGWERPGPQKADCEKKFVATSKTGKAVTQRRKEEKS